MRSKYLVEFNFEVENGVKLFCYQNVTLRSDGVLSNINYEIPVVEDVMIGESFVNKDSLVGAYNLWLAYALENAPRIADLVDNAIIEQLQIDGILIDG